MRTQDILRHLKLLPSYLRLSLLRTAEDKIQLWGAFATSVISIVLYVFFWNVITYQIPVLTGVGWVVWGRAELTFLIGVTEIAWGFGSFAYMGLWEVHWYITEIGLEEFRIRPVSSIYQIFVQNFWAGGLLQVAIGGAMLFLSMITFGLVVIPINLVLGVIALLIGQAALYTLWGCLCCLAFWIGRNQGLLEVSDAIEMNFARMPIDIMPLGVQYFLTFILPVIFISTIPTMIMLGQLPLGLTLVYFGIAGVLVLVWSVVFSYLWTKGVKRYQPVGG
ncbi:MAG: ABC transporter permease [Candidatus Odinarchaeota archaeon]